MDKIIFTVKEVSEIIHTNQTYVYKLINVGILPAIKLGSYKIRKESLLKFLEDYEGYDLTNPEKVIYNIDINTRVVDKTNLSSICPRMLSDDKL